MVSMRGLAALAAAGLLGAAAKGCGGLSPSDADMRCNQEKQAKRTCFDDSVFQGCQACFERCGDSCQSEGASCPLVYVCPGDAPADAGG
jgi:hypothetical protein